MIDENHLRLLGFTDFEHLNKNKKDSKRRLAAVRFIENQCFTIVLVFQNNSWIVDQFTFDGDESIYKNIFHLSLL